MTQPAQTAYVQIVADFTGFARTLEAGVTKAFAQARPSLSRAADTIGKVLEAAARDGGSSLQELGHAGQRAGTEIETELSAAARSGRESMSDLSRSVSSAAGEFGSDFARNGEQAERSMRELAGSTEVSMDAVVHDAHRASAAIGGIGGAARLAGTLILGLSTAATAGLGLLTTFGLKAAAAQEQTLISFESLLGSAQKGQAVFEQIRQFAAATPFELPQLTDVAKRFLTFSKTVGIAEDQLIPFLTTVGNIASVTGSGALGMDRVALALGQIASKGKLSLEELNQISEGLPGFSGIAAIAAAKGITTAEAMKQISAGTISAKDGVAALLQGMQKFPGAASAMEKQSQTLLGLFSTFKDEVTESLIGGFAPVIPDLKKTLADVTPVVKEAIAGLAPILGNLLAALGPLVADLIRALNPILGPIIEGLRKGLEALRPALRPLGEAIGRLVTAFAPFLPILGEAIAKLVIGLIPAIDEWTRQLPVLLPDLLELTKALLPVIPPLTALVVEMTKASKAMLVLLALAAQFDRFLVGLNWGEILGAIGGFFTDLWHHITRFFSSLGAQLGALPSKASAAFTVFRDIAVARIKDVIGVVASLPGRIGAIMSDLAGQMFNAGARIIGNLINGILSMASRLANTMADLVRRGIRDFLPFSPAKVGPLHGGGDPLLAGQKIVDRLAAGIAAATGTLAGATSLAVDVHPGPTNVSVWIGGHELRGVVSSVVDERNRQLRATVRSRSQSGTRPW
jgi:tape measure domain-containing protein